MNSITILRYLIATELAYRKRFILIVYGVAAAVIAVRWAAMLRWTGLADTPEGVASQVELSLWLTIAAGALVSHGLFSGFERQRRDRLLTPAPLARRTVVASRLLAVVSIHAIPLVLWTAGFAVLESGVIAGYDGTVGLSTLPPRYYDGNGWTLLAFLAIGLYVCFVVALVHAWKKPAWGNLLFLVGAVLFTNFCIYPAGSSPDVFLPGYDVFQSIWGVLYYGAAAAAVAGVTAAVSLRGGMSISRKNE